MLMLEIETLATNMEIFYWWDLVLKRVGYKGYLIFLAGAQIKNSIARKVTKTTTLGEPTQPEGKSRKLPDFESSLPLISSNNIIEE